MKLLKNSELIGIALLLAVGLGACSKPGPAEIAGKKIDQTADDAVKKINQAADKVGDKIGEQGFKAGVAIDDAEITAKIKAAIFAEPGLKSMQISVDTVKGVVTLTGSVSTKSLSDMAKGLASAVAGVREVDNRLMLKPIG
ncbi:MAG: BON domain-containing protein [Proteobacteria bacterium]|nr:BON domain-containing protein [Pseudomonadota bacterium]